MSAEKTRAIVLKVLPYKESSCILYLFTENHGLVHGVAKGIRQKKKQQDFIERGFLIEVIVYFKPQRELHTLGTCHVVSFFPEIRTSIIKSALRDAVFEMALAAITVADFHPELFILFQKYLEHINTVAERECHPFALWLFYYRFAEYMGFGFDIAHCLGCGKTLTRSGASFINSQKGGLMCPDCAKGMHEQWSIPACVLSFLHQGTPKPEQLKKIISTAQSKQITRLLSDFCRYHFDIHKEYKALVFLDEMTVW